MILPLFVPAVAGLSIVAAVLLQQVGQRRDRKRFAEPGRMIAAGLDRLHVLEKGSGTPAVVFEAGLAASSLSWSYVQPLIAQFTQTLSYDRAGLGWSKRSRTPRRLNHLVDELEAVLGSTNVSPPYVLVGHSFGALIIRAFAHTRSRAVAGLVLIDPVSIESWARCTEADRRRLAMGAKLSRRGAWLARLGVVRFATAAAGFRREWITKVIARTSAGRATPLLGRLVGEIRKLPPAAIPAVRAQWSGPKCFEAMAQYLECLPECAAAAASMHVDESIPIVVLSAASATAQELAERDGWIQRSKYGEHTQIPDTGHWLHLENPTAVADAIQGVVSGERVRSVSQGVRDVIDADAKAER